MTDSSSVEGLEHWLTLGGFVFVGVTSLLAWASGSREGAHIAAAQDKEAATSCVAASVGGAAGAGIIDLTAYRAVVEGLESVNKRLGSIDAKMARLVELGENQDEREAREQQHRDLRDMMQEMIDGLKEEIRQGEQRRSARKALPGA